MELREGTGSRQQHAAYSGGAKRNDEREESRVSSQAWSFEAQATMASLGIAFSEVSGNDWGIMAARMESLNPSIELSSPPLARSVTLESLPMISVYCVTP